MPDTPSEHSFRTATGTIIVRAGAEAQPWLLTWLPDSPGDPNYPGFTLSSDFEKFPTTSHHDAAEWAAARPWANYTPSFASGGVEALSRSQSPSPSPSPSPEAPLEGFEWRFRVVREPDDSYSWWVSVGKEIVQSGIAPNLEDAKIASIIDLFPPSDEWRRE